MPPKQGFSGTLSERFDRKWIPEPNTGCWLWTGSVNSQGYGKLLGEARALRMATHVSLELVGTFVPPDRYVCHHCDVPACVNPDHLFIGTQKENIADCISKGRKTDPPPSEPGRGRKLTCRAGHPLEGYNVLLKNNGVRRGCRECGRVNRIARYLRSRKVLAGPDYHRAPTHKWNDEERQRLMEMIERGDSNPSMAVHFGVTRKAIEGQLSRLGLSRHAKDRGA
jgi:hypothetical protein